MLYVPPLFTPSIGGLQDHHILITAHYFVLPVGVCLVVVPVCQTFHCFRFCFFFVFLAFVFVCGAARCYGSVVILFIALRLTGLRCSCCLCNCIIFSFCSDAMFAVCIFVSVCSVGCCSHLFTFCLRFTYVIMIVTMFYQDLSARGGAIVVRASPSPPRGADGRKMTERRAGVWGRVAGVVARSSRCSRDPLLTFSRLIVI